MEDTVITMTVSRAHHMHACRIVGERRGNTAGTC